MPKARAAPNSNGAHVELTRSGVATSTNASHSRRGDRFSEVTACPRSVRRPDVEAALPHGVRDRLGCRLVPRGVRKKDAWLRRLLAHFARPFALALSSVTYLSKSFRANPLFW